MGLPWDVHYIILLAFLWDFHGASMGLPFSFHGASMELECSFWISLGIHWSSISSMTLEWDFHGTPTRFSYTFSINTDCSMIMLSSQKNKVFIIRAKYRNPPIQENLYSKSKLSVSQKSTHVHDKRSCESGRRPWQGFRQEIGVLIFRLYVRDVKLSVLDMFSGGVITHIDVLRIRVEHRVNRHLDRTLLSSKTWMHGSPKSGNRKRHTDRRKSALKPLQHTRSHSRRVWCISAS